MFEFAVWLTFFPLARFARALVWPSFPGEYPPEPPGLAPLGPLYGFPRPDLLTARLAWFLLRKASSPGQNSFKASSEANHEGVWPSRRIILVPERSEPSGVWGKYNPQEWHTKARGMQTVNGLLVETQHMTGHICRVCSASAQKMVSRQIILLEVWVTNSKICSRISIGLELVLLESSSTYISAAKFLCD
jgi:hypothetical protein